MRNRIYREYPETWNASIKSWPISISGNAYNYTHSDGQINIRIHQEGDDVQVDVKDTGIGISPEEEKRIFERFYRGEDPLVLATAGNGLGLSITKQLIEMHHGRIWMESNGVPGDGSTFYFTLPIHASDEDAETLY
jgi:signal transduction histidine kinase